MSVGMGDVQGPAPRLFKASSSRRPLHIEFLLLERHEV